MRRNPPAKGDDKSGWLYLAFHVLVKRAAANFFVE